MSTNHAPAPRLPGTPADLHGARDGIFKNKVHRVCTMYMYAGQAAAARGPGSIRGHAYIMIEYLVTTNSGDGNVKVGILVRAGALVDRCTRISPAYCGVGGAVRVRQSIKVFEARAA